MQPFQMAFTILAETISLWQRQQVLHRLSFIYKKVIWSWRLILDTAECAVMWAADPKTSPGLSSVLLLVAIVLGRYKGSRQVDPVTTGQTRAAHLKKHIS